MKRDKKLESNKAFYTQDGHTKQPWKYEKPDLAQCRVIGFAGQLVANVGCGNAGVLPNGMKDDWETMDNVAIENAAIISASPELYELVRMIATGNYGDLMEKYPVCDDFYDVDYAVKARAQELIRRIQSDYYERRKR